MVEFIKVYKDGDCWGAFTRENIAEGECAFADTPREAAQNQYEAFLKPGKVNGYKLVPAMPEKAAEVEL